MHAINIHSLGETHEEEEDARKRSTEVER